MCSSPSCSAWPSRLSWWRSLPAAEIADFGGLKKLGIEKVPPNVARGVLLDMAAYYKTDIVPQGTAFNKAEIDAAAAAKGVTIREGDVVLFYTGWVKLIGNDSERYIARACPASAVK